MDGYYLQRLTEAADRIASALEKIAQSDIRIRAPKQSETRHCMNCDGPIPAGSRLGRMYCSHRCRVAYQRYRKRLAEQPHEEGQTS